MISDKEILLQAIEQFACNTANNLFGINSIAAQTLIRYAIRNVADKYDPLINVIIDKIGHINQDILADAFKSEVRCRGGINLFGVKFTETDFEEMLNIYNNLRQNSNV